jgi:hypothetical protein
LAVFGLAFCSALIVLIETEAHGCCITPPCYPLTIIKECGIPRPVLHSLQDAIIPLASLGVGMTLVLFVIRRYLQRKDFYVVKYRGG